MPVLELTQLRLRGMAANEPEVFQSLSLVRDKLQTQSRFYTCIEDPSLMYILGMWPTLAAHQHFLASSRREEILGSQESMFHFGWTVHMELDTIHALPFHAPVLAIGRWLMHQRDACDEFNQLAMSRLHLPQDRCCSYKTVHGWRCDRPTGSYEAIVLSGWNDVRESRSHKIHADVDVDVERRYEKIVLHHATNLERTNS